MTPSQKYPRYDAIVCGAGPVGLLLACELALANCTVLVLEQATDPDSPLKRPPFGIRGLSAPSIDALYRRGLLDALLPSSIPKTSLGAAPRQGGHFAGIPFDEDAIDTTRWPERAPHVPTTLVSSMAALDAVLTRRAQELGVRILRGLAVSDVRQHDAGVTVVAGEASFEGAWVVGCDGARSRVRKVSGIDFVGTEPEFTGYSTQLDIATPHPLQTGRHATAAGLYVYAPPGYLVIQDIDGGAGHDAGRAPTRDEVQAVLRRVSGTTVTVRALHLATTWTDRARQAERYRHGRILLAGDAAHIHAPLGGQGLNLGLGDAMNLGWKLAATIHGTAPDGLLDSYHTERHPIGAAVLDWSRAQVAAMRLDPGSRALRAVLHALMQTRDGASFMAEKIRGIATHIDLGGKHALVGYGAPDIAFADGTRLGTCMRAGRGVLLDLQGNGELAAFARGYGGRIDYVARRPATASSTGAMLIRPDGIVAWAGDAAGDPGGLREAAERCLITPRPCRPDPSAMGR